MNNGPSPSEQPKKKRGRPPGIKKGGTSTHTVEDHPLDTDYEITLSAFLQTILLHNRAEVARVARELSVAENTVYRWMKGTSHPRPLHLQHLPEVLPAYQEQLIAIIGQNFDNSIRTSSLPMREVSKEIYRRVLEAVTINCHDAETRFWQITEIIFNDALEQLDAKQQGLAITYAKLMSPHPDGIHSLREVKMRGHAP